MFFCSVFMAWLAPGVEPLEENASGFIHSMNASLGSGERQLIVHSLHKARTITISTSEGVMVYG
jgi:hypothetical protein